ncbi:hypothetical protein E2C01_011004 [Portunus trituberculatus]|uniref:Uncharacterized protein n=1 Tax=Portunus trituberculatus TaxID=210409 RepID=A0A5B7DA99_PORTR|nr:hypothetical protein [Portunus trituberculatus]
MLRLRVDFAHGVFCTTVTRPTTSSDSPPLQGIGIKPRLLLPQQTTNPPGQRHSLDTVDGSSQHQPEPRRQCDKSAILYIIGLPKPRTDTPRRPRSDLPALCHTAKLSPTRRPQPQVTAYRVSKPVVVPWLTRPALVSAHQAHTHTHTLTTATVTSGGVVFAASHLASQQASKHTHAHSSSDGVTCSVYVAS